MREFVKGVLRERTAVLSTSQTQKIDDNEKRLRIFIDEIIQLAFEQKCFTEDEMISETLTMLIAVKLHLLHVEQASFYIELNSVNYL